MTSRCCINITRLFLLWRFFRDMLLRTLPKRFVLAKHTSVRFGNRFAFKTVLNSVRAPLTLAILWMTALLFLAFWYRAVEMTACVFSPPHLLNPACKLETAQVRHKNGSYIT